MAKKVSSFSISDLEKQMKKINPLGDVIEKSDYTVTKDWIGTGNYHLNAQFSGDLFKGIPSNKSVLISGESGVGKTFLLLNIAREAQEMGYYVIYYDSEGAIDKENIKSFNIDSSRFNHQPVSDLNKFRTLITSTIKSLLEVKEGGGEVPKIIIFLDSIGMLATTKEIDDAISGSTAADMTRAKMIRSLFRIITSDLSGLDIPLIIANHTYQSLGLYSQTHQSGGQGIVYAPSIITNLTKANLREGTEQTGIIVTARPQKNRYVKPTTIRLQIKWDSGMNSFLGLEEYISWDVCGIEKGNIITSAEYKKLKPSELEDVRSFIFDNNEMYFMPKSTARNFIVKHLGRGVTPKELFTSEVFTRDVLEQINEKCIKGKFSYSTIDEDSIYDDLIDDLNGENDIEIDED